MGSLRRSFLFVVQAVFLLGFLCPHSLVLTAMDKGMGTEEWLKRRGWPVVGSRFEMTPPGQSGRGEKQPQ